jgi:hypothetical protein
VWAPDGVDSEAIARDLRFERRLIGWAVTAKASLQLQGLAQLAPRQIVSYIAFFCSKQSLADLLANAEVCFDTSRRLRKTQTWEKLISWPASAAESISLEKAIRQAMTNSVCILKTAS